MQKQQILPVLYDLAVTIGGEVALTPMLTRTLQRLLFHSSYAAGFVCLDLPPCGEPNAMVSARIDAAVGDFDLIGKIGQSVQMPCNLLHGCGDSGANQAEVLRTMGLKHSQYRSCYRLPLPGQGVIVLMAAHTPDSSFDLAQVLQPVLAQLDRAVLLCRAHDAQQLAAQQAQSVLVNSLAALQTQYKTLIDISPLGILLAADGSTLDCNQVFLDMLGYDSVDQLRGLSVLNFVVPQERQKIEELIRLRASNLPAPETYETVGLRRDGSTLPILLSARRIQTPQGGRSLAYLFDLTRQKHTEHELTTANARLRQVLETAPLRIFWKDLDSRYLGCNTAFAKDAGLSRPEQVIGKLDTELGWAAQAELYRADDLQVMQSKTAQLGFEEPQTTPNGQQIWLRTSKVPLLDPDGSVDGVLGVYEDITEQKRNQERIHQLAYYDALTGMPNRTLLQEQLQKAMAVSTHTQSHGAVIFLDLDDFKNLNDSHGPAIGDRLLKEVGARLTDCVGEQGMVARSGGDLFILLLEGLSPAPDEAGSQTESVVERVRNAMVTPFYLDAKPSSFTASMGIVLFHGTEATADFIFKHADTAMNQAKQEGKNTTRFFDPQMQAALESRIAMVTDLTQALTRGEFRLYFQKQVNAQGLTTGAEVLLRWLHPQRGLVSPAQFIPLAEATGIIIPLGLWVLQAACQQLKSWQRRATMRDLSLAINVSARQFREPDFVDQVRRVLVQTAVKPSQLKLELTESVVVKDVEGTIAKMRELKLLGLRFSMDDFGTGYSSLQYLKRLPLDQLKIDQSFVRDVTIDSNEAAIVQTIIAMTDALGLDVIAEGVETREQKEFLEQRGCHAFQGYLFGKPMPLTEFEKTCDGNAS